MFDVAAAPRLRFILQIYITPVDVPDTLMHILRRCTARRTCMDACMSSYVVDVVFTAVVAGAAACYMLYCKRYKCAL